MKIKNINGTSQNTCKCGSWLKHWQKFSGWSLTYCPVDGCLRTDLVGAHVQQDGSNDKRWYICPLCSSHNAQTGPLDVGATKLVTANVSETCGK
jgi:hypothetical protein